MHCEQNFANNFLKTIIGEKDTMKVWHDLRCKGIRPHLWLIANLRRGGKMLKPLAPYVLTTIEFNTFAFLIENLKTPSSHVSTMA
jgi:hypothetical protein